MEFRVVFKVEPRKVLGTSNYSKINDHNPFSTLFWVRQIVPKSTSIIPFQPYISLRQAFAETMFTCREI